MTTATVSENKRIQLGCVRMYGRGDKGADTFVTSAMQEANVARLDHTFGIQEADAILCGPVPEETGQLGCATEQLSDVYRMFGF